MRIYVLASLLLVLAAPLLVLQIRSLKGLFIHVGLVCFFHAMGGLALSIGLSMFSQRLIFWTWVFFSLSLNFYLGSIFFIWLARTHAEGTSHAVMEDIRRHDPTEEVLLERRHLLWPLVLFPSRMGVQTVLFTGRRWVSGIKAGFGLTKLSVTKSRLVAQLLCPNILIIDIQRADMGAIGFVDQEKDLVGIHYNKSRVSPFTRLLVFSGMPAVRNTILLNLGEESQRWLTVLTAAPH